MPRLMLVLIAATACGGSESRPEVLESDVRRVADVHLEVRRSSAGPGASRYAAAVAVWPGSHVGETRENPPTECVREGAAGGTRGLRVGEEFELDFGRSLRVAWDGGEGRYHVDAPGDGRDLAWQPVAVRSGSTGGAWLSADGALQFGESLAARATRRDDGGIDLQWDAAYEPGAVQVRVTSPSGTWVCPAEDGQATAPWWAVASPRARLWLAATRIEQTLLPDGTLVVGHATLVEPVPLDPDPARSASRERHGPSLAPAPARPVGRPDRWERSPWFEGVQPG